jgi:hypothetical protein
VWAGAGPSCGVVPAYPVRGLVERRVQAQARDRSHVRAHLIQPFERGIGAVSHHDRLPVRQPAPQLEHHLPGPVAQPLVSPTPLGSIALGGTERRQEGQRPEKSSLADWRIPSAVGE